MEALVFGSFAAFSLVAVGCRFFANKLDQSQNSKGLCQPFVKFQRIFYIPFFLALFGDWLQGPYVYKLYSYYGYEEGNIAVLYIAGFASSVTLGTFTGSLADKIGRKKIAIAYCFIYIFCCLTKLSPNFWVLMIGRIFGGIATSMLFSSFESWYVYEHQDRGYPADLMPNTFSFTTLFNGLLAIFAGVISNFVAEGLGYGPVSPFLLAIPPLLACAVVIMTSWPENYGDKNAKICASCSLGFREIMEDKEIMMLGFLQTMVESCMYIFVFLWTPVMSLARPPYGMVFATFMLAVMIGSSIYSIMLSKSMTSGQALRASLIIISVTMAICGYLAVPGRTNFDIQVLFFTFVLFEVAIGIYFPSMSYLKSQIIPEAHRANVMNLFRVPMNIITCAALLCLNNNYISTNKNLVFIFCFVLSLAGIAVINVSIANGPEKRNGREGKRPLINEIA